MRPTIELADEDGRPARVGQPETALDLTLVLRQLSTGQRLVVSLFYYLDLPIAEIAQVVDCSIGTVKSTLSDARQRLRTLLGEEHR